MDTRIHAVEFNEENHTYTYDGRTLHGITGTIGKLKGKEFPDTDTVKIATMYGSDVHSEVEHYFNDHDNWFNDSELSTEGAKWVVSELKDFCKTLKMRGDMALKVKCEVMVSDFEGTASKVDVVVETAKGFAILFDIKTTSHFDRAYCSLQLSVYSELYERCYDGRVNGLYVLGTKSRRKFRIIKQDNALVELVLEMNRG